MHDLLCPVISENCRPTFARVANLGLQINYCPRTPTARAFVSFGSSAVTLFHSTLSGRCGCDECVTSSEQDSLRHSQSRINAYKALSSSSLIALSSKDPISTAFHLSWELRRLSRMETEFRAEYTVSFASHARSDVHCDSE